MWQVCFCGVNISSRYPLVELLTAVLGLLVAWVLDPLVSTLMALILMYMLVALAFIDINHTILPDQLTLPLIVLVSAVAGIVAALLMRLRSTPTYPQMPFGPFLSAGGLVYLLWGEQLWRLFQL